MRKSLFAIALAALVVGLGFYAVAGSLFTDVASHSTPLLVDEVNTALDALEDGIDGTSSMTATGKTLTALPTVTSMERVWLRLAGGDTAVTTSSNDVYSTVYLFRMYNDAGGATTGAVDFAQIVTTASDVTGDTEDATSAIQVMVNGTMTTIATVSGTALTVVGDVAGTTIGGITQANLVDKAAAEVISGTRNFTSTISVDGNAGFSGVVTNNTPGNTNTFYYSEGIVTNVVTNP